MYRKVLPACWEGMAGTLRTTEGVVMLRTSHLPYWSVGAPPRTKVCARRRVRALPFRARTRATRLLDSSEDLFQALPIQVDIRKDIVHHGCPNRESHGGKLTQCRPGCTIFPRAEQPNGSCDRAALLVEEQHRLRHYIAGKWELVFRRNGRRWRGKTVPGWWMRLAVDTAWMWWIDEDGRSVMPAKIEAFTMVLNPIAALGQHATKGGGV